MIFGGKHFEELIFGDDRIKEPQKQITYRLSCFGWLVIGRQSQSQPENKSTRIHYFFICSEPDSLEQFWKVKKFRQQHIGDQKNRNSSITSKVPPDATRSETLS